MGIFALDLLCVAIRQCCAASRTDTETALLLILIEDLQAVLNTIFVLLQAT